MRHAVATVARPTAVLLLLVALGPVACNEPELDDEPGAPAAGAPSSDEPPEPEHEELLARIGDLEAAVGTAAEQLEEAATTDDPTAAGAAVNGALAALLDDPATTGGPPALLPATTTDRGGGGGTDALTATLTLARETGGELGTATLDTLRFPIAGDLGAWERDPEGMLAAVDEAVGRARSLEQREDAVLELPGDATRALAWTVAAERARTANDRRLAAERALAHLEVVAGALADLRDHDEPSEDPA